MKNFSNRISPFTTFISFHKVIETLEEIAKSTIDFRANYAKGLLKEVASKPELINGIDNYDFIIENEEIIKYLLADLFPTALTNNEIKAVTLPYQNITFNYSERFKKILKEAGSSFDINIRDFDEHQFYIMSCTIILNLYYKQKIDVFKPLFYDIPDADGIIRHYRILYNADFIEIAPSPSFKHLTESEINQLIDNYQDLDLWKEKFPPNSWTLKGFVIVSLIDVTVENAISNLKTYLLKPEVSDADQKQDAESIFRSVFKIPDLQLGLTLYNEEEGVFEKPVFSEEKISSFILLDQLESDCKKALCGCTYKALVEQKELFVIPDVEKFKTIEENKKFGEKLSDQNIKSCLFAPILKDDKLIGILELTSKEIRSLNSINANKLELVMPFIKNTIIRSIDELENQLDAIIQNEYTTIHPSVYWKFKKEAKNYYINNLNAKEYGLQEIVFKNVYPLYGQIDIKSSSELRNKSLKEDLKNQLVRINDILNTSKISSNLVIIEQRKYDVNQFILELKTQLKTDTETRIQHFIENEIHPIFNSVKKDVSIKNKIQKYFDDLDPITKTYYHERKKFDESLASINKKLAEIIDRKQIEAQNIFPHYYERFKTDGIEHNLYIGESIAPHNTFDKLYINNLRLWQLQTLCEMVIEHHKIAKQISYPLDVTSLLLVFSSPLSIRFRLDEKRFDVDGSYNARYEVIKKRIDKAHIKGTNERIIEKEKITIVYAQMQEQMEYMKYIHFLQYKAMLAPQIEEFEVEDLQGISGLKAIRVKVLFKNNEATNLPNE